MTDLTKLHTLLSAKTRPEEIFGPLAGSQNEKLGALKSAFRAMALIAHPDRAPNNPLAEKTFQLLETFRHDAETRILSNLYGQPDPAPTPLTTRKSSYLIHQPLAQSDYYTLYRCTQTPQKIPADLLLKIVRNPRDNDLLEKEAHNLRTLIAASPAAARYAPQLIDAFLSTDSTSQRRALILAIPPHNIPLPRIRAAYPAGLDPRDAAWILNRLLEALYLTHKAGLVHAAILPQNLSPNLATHGLTLTDWAYATPIGQPLSAISNESWYPAELLAMAPATPGADIYMAARTFLYLLGGNPIFNIIPATLPAPLQNFIKGCLLPAPARRPNDAGDLREEFGELLRKLYGKRTFRPLAIPA